MKILIWLIFISLNFVSASDASCNKKITNNNVILFLDINGGTKEIEEAKKAACDRGQLLVVYPEQSVEVYKITSDKAFYENKLKAMKCDKNPEGKGCADFKTKFTKVEEEITNKANMFSNQGLEETLKKLNKDQGRNVESLVISGHSDGKSIFGAYGVAEQRNIQKSFNKQPDQGKSVTSLIMLACYSATPSTILSWKKSLPELKMIAGSDSSAASSDRPAGLRYLKDLLLKVKDLTADADEKKMNARLKVLIPTLKEINSAIYIDSNKCGEANGDKRFFYSKSSGGLNVFNPEACEEAIKKYKEKEEIINGYMDGSTPIPLETHGTPLREAYSFLRQNAHCLEAGEVKYTADMLYGLLFYHQVKINAIRAYKAEADEINQFLKDFGIEKAWPLTEENIKNKDRKEILDNIEALYSITENMSGIKITAQLNQLENSLGKMTCGSPEWHDIQASPSAPMCAIADFSSVLTIEPAGTPQVFGSGMGEYSGNAFGEPEEN